MLFCLKFLAGTLHCLLIVNFFDHTEHTDGLPDCILFITASAYTRFSFSLRNDKICDLMLSN